MKRIMVIAPFALLVGCGGQGPAALDISNVNLANDPLPVLDAAAEQCAQYIETATAKKLNTSLSYQRDLDNCRNVALNVLARYESALQKMDTSNWDERKLQALNDGNNKIIRLWTDRFKRAPDLMLTQTVSQAPKTVFMRILETTNKLGTRLEKQVQNEPKI